MMLRLSITVGLAALLVGCGNSSGSTGTPQTGTDVGNGATVSFNVHGYTAPSSMMHAKLALGDGTRIDDAWVVIDRVRLRPGSDCSGNDDNVDVQGPLVSEILTSGIVGGAPSFKVTPGPFCRFRTDFAKIDAADLPDGVPAALGDHTILVEGERADGTPFTVSSRLNVTYERDAKAGKFEVYNKASLFLAFELDPWIAALDLGTLTGSSITIDDDYNKDRLQAFEAAVQASGAIFKDANDDGMLSTSETDDADQLTQ